jgi:hypothetical protein
MTSDNLIWLEIKRLLSRRNMVLLIVLIFLSLFSVYKGYHEYRATIKGVNEFQEIEDRKADGMVNYLDYSHIGVGSIFVPSPLMIFFSNDHEINGVVGRINSVGALEVNNNRKNIPIINNQSIFNLRFGNVIFIFFSMVSLYLGFELTHNREILKFLGCMVTSARVYITIIGVRVSFLVICFLSVFGCIIGFTYLLSINLDAFISNGSIGYISSTVVMILFFFFSGAAIGHIRSKFGGIAVLVWWLAMTFFIPGAVHSLYIEKSHETTSSNRVYLNTLNILDRFEKEAEKKFGKPSNSNKDIVDKVIGGYLDNEFKQIESHEKQYYSEVAGIINNYNDLCLLTPVTFYQLTSSEVSSLGLSNYLKFYKYLRLMFRQFTLFWVDRVYYSDSKEVVNFVTGDENLFKAQSRLPDNFGLGILINLGYVVVLIILSFFLFRRSLYMVDKGISKRLGTFDIQLVPGKIKALYVESGDLKDVLYAVLSGKLREIRKNGLSSEIHFNDVQISDTETAIDFLYIPGRSEIPGDTKVKNLVLYSMLGMSKSDKKDILLRPEIVEIKDKRFMELEKGEEFAALLALSYGQKRDVYLINDIGLKLSGELLVKLKIRFDELKSMGAAVIYLSSERLDTKLQIGGTSYSANYDSWEYLMEALKLQVNHESNTSSQSLGIRKNKHES